jgi:hypothetical protein
MNRPRFKKQFPIKRPANTIVRAVGGSAGDSDWTDPVSHMSIQISAWPTGDALASPLARMRQEESMMGSMETNREDVNTTPGLYLTPLLVLILLFAPLQNASGDPVSAERAKAAVRGWLKADQAPLQTTVGQNIKRVETFNDGNGTTLYHVIHLDPEGFVIVAADDLIEPIIAFAPRGQFDPSTKNPLGALVSRDLPGRHARVEGIKAATAQGLPLAARSKWDRLNSMDPAGPSGGFPFGLDDVSDVRVAPLTQTTWDQLTNSSANACYNYYTPPYAEGTAANYYCGCVATAMAQLMRFWQYPVLGVGTSNYTIMVDGVSTNRNLRGGDGAGGPYDWINMVTTTPSTLAQRQAIGALCADAGVSVHMQYASDASGADESDATSALVNTFGYANAVYGGHNDDANNNIGAGLNGMVNPNLDAGCPVLFGISENGDYGHSIVCDGYGYQSSTLYHHLNFGWSGDWNLWYNLPDINAFNLVSDCVYNVWTNGTGEIISGRITDQGGKPITGVVVTATRTGGGTYTATSNPQGIYALAKIPSSSTYALSMSITGYSFTNQIVRTGQSKNNSVTSGNQWAINFTSMPYCWTINNGAITIAGYNGYVGAVTIPDTLNGLPVTTIGTNAFHGCTSLTSIAIPNSVTSIGDSAFSGCTSLTSIAIPSSVTSIGDSAFSGCTGLTSVTIGTNLTSIGDFAFGSCTELSSVCFQGNNAPSLGGTNVFHGDNNASAYYLLGSTGWGPTFGGIQTSLWSPQVPCFYLITNGTITITKYIGSGTAVTIPDTINSLRVTTIGANAFSGCSGLTNVTIGTNVTNIGNSAFYECTSLTSVTIPNSVTTIGGDAFGGCGRLTGVTIGDSVTSIGDGAFGYCPNLTSITIGTNVTNIGRSAFYECTSLTSVTIPSSVTSIGDIAFSGCTSLTSVTIPDSVTTIGDYTFQYCNSLTNVTIPNSVTSIGQWAFWSCSSLTGVTIGNSVTSIGESAFRACFSLTGVCFQGNAPSVDTSSFLFDDNATVYYLPGTTGWDSTLGGLPTVLWNPQVPISDTSFGVRANRFGFTITGATNLTVVIEAAPDLVNPAWLPVGTNTLNDGLSYFCDPQWTNYPARFYRLRSK